MRRTGCPRSRKEHYSYTTSQILTDDRAGGIFVVSGTGKIELNNTFEERLRMCETDALPTVRATLFGENENRKFHD